MARSFIAYDKDLPEIPGRCPWEKPASFLVKDETAPNGWRVNEEGRRPSKLLLTGKLRQAVDRWRDEDYPGASPVAARLFEYWFKEDHEVTGFEGVFRYHFCQREAIETLIYLVEIAGVRDAVKLVQDYAEVFQKDLLEKNIEFVTTMDGQRRIRRYVPELEAMGEQDLPMENLRRYAVKMATGSGKTWVMAMAMVWSHFHKRMVAGSELSTNFLIVAPNVIVYQRLERDFAGYLARKIGEAIVEKRAIEFERSSLKLSNTKPFTWVRNLSPEPAQAKKTIFNFVATYNDFERRFAYFLDEARDVLRFASLGTTEQGESGVQFRVNYLKSSGAIGFYHPDWVVVQKTPQGEINWIIETKGRVWEGTEAKDAAMEEWCALVSQQSGALWKYARVNQRDFEKLNPKLLEEIAGQTESSNLL